MHSWRNFSGGLSQDVRYAVRWFRRELILTGVVVATLAFGIGLNAGVFSVLSGMVFRSRVERDPGTFFQVLASPMSQPSAPPHLFSSSVADLALFRTAPGVASMAAWAVSSGRLQEDADPSLLMLVTCDFFALYGLDNPRYGRLFQPADCAPGAGSVVLLGEQLWRDRFHSDPTLVGRSIRINRGEYHLAGIVPASFAGRLRGPGIWIPYTAQAAFYGGVDLLRDAERPWLTIEGRRLATHSQAAITRELTALAGPRTLALTNGSIFQDPGSRTIAAAFAVLLTGALAMILLLACTNVTMLLLSRAVDRRYEMSVRLALGASRGRLLRMAATEGILLSLLSAAFSAALAAAVPAALVRLIPRMPHYPVHTDWVVFTYLAGITLLAGFSASMLPALESLRTDLNGSLRKEESFFAGHRRWRLREALVALQVAMSVVLVVGAFLFARTQYRLFVADPGFDARHVMLTSLAPGSSAATMAEIESRLRGISGVRSVAFATSIFWTRSEGSTLRLSGGRIEPAAISAVSANFFDTLGMPVSRGRSLDPSASRRVIVSQAAADRLWPGSDVLGQKFQTLDGVLWEVGGIVRESELDRRSPAPRIFRIFEGPVPGSAVVLLNYKGDPAVLSRVVTRTIDAAGANLRELPRTLEADIAEIGSRFRVGTGFAVFFGSSAFFLAITGIYGVMSFAIKRRTREMGIRLALGANRTDILQQVLRSGLRPVGAGLAIGMPLSAFAAGLLQYAFRNTPTPFAARDPLAFGAVPLAMLACAVVAMLRPALFACSVNPAASLRDP